MPTRRALATPLALVTAAAAALVVAQTAPASAGSGAPTFVNFAAPASLPNSNNAGEPSIGATPRGALMYQAYASTYKVTVDPGTLTPTWSNVTPLGASFNIDPILATDRSTGRTFAGGLAGECSALNITDNDGASWTPAGNACAGVVDHESIGIGPWHGAAPLGATYNRAVYYCAQSGTDACSTSTNGGTTFGPPVLVNGACGSLHGHVKVSADGTAYLPNAHCGGAAGGGITTNNGASWTSYTIPGSGEPSDGFDPSVATTPDNTVYEAWSGPNFHPYVARSTSHGAAWDRMTDLSTTMNPPIVTSTFQASVAGDNGRIAIAYLGSTTGGNPFQSSWNGVWDLYVSYSFDAGQTWSTVKATTDPVQRGWMCSGGTSCSSGRNLLDFMDATMTPDGRVAVGYADGCVDACAQPGGTPAQSSSARATIAYQSGGQNLLAAYDTTPGPSASPTASSSPSPTASPSPSTNPSPSASPSPTASPTPSSTPSPNATVLTSGSPASGTNAAAGSFVYYAIQVPAGATKLQATLSGPPCGLLSCNPDLDLYAKAGSEPTTASYDAASTTSSNSESVSISNPAAGWMYLGVYTYAGASGKAFQLTATTS